ncbi:hypothetical protein EWM64_g10756, partial [Hericium alpestre]
LCTFYDFTPTDSRLRLKFSVRRLEMATVAGRRLRKELAEIHTQGCPMGITLLQADDFETWLLSVEVLGESLYQGEVFALMFRFDNQYPISSPAVQFVVNEQYKPPVHPVRRFFPFLPHLQPYSPPARPISTFTRTAMPEGNDRYVRTAPDNPKKTRFLYDDDTV